ncbi:MAG: hypothetical protein ACRDT5_14920 [Mycobacterium sp.]
MEELFKRNWLIAARAQAAGADPATEMVALVAQLGSELAFPAFGAFVDAVLSFVPAGRERRRR